MRNLFRLSSDFQPKGDQPSAIKSLVHNIKNNVQNQVLLGVTGSGKTFTVAHTIAQVNKPTLVIAHNKTLAMQLYLEFKHFFPENRVEYFVSNFDFYQPEAYLPSKDLYIDKDVKHNIELDMMRMSATNSLLTRKDTIVVASVAAIFAAQDPVSYKATFFEIRVSEKVTRHQILRFLVHSGYIRNNIELSPGTFSAKGDLIKIVPSYSNLSFIRISLDEDVVESIALVDPVNHTVQEKVNSVTIFPAQAYMTSRHRLTESIHRIKQELDQQLIKLKEQNQLVEFNRLKQRTEKDIQDLEEYGHCAGIENYSRHLDLRAKGEKPFTLIDYFGDDFLTIIDESHMTLPQIRGMYNTNLSRKKTLIQYGFRLPSALDNRPLDFGEFQKMLKQTVYTSATPGDYELGLSKEPVRQIVRPTGLLNPDIQVLPVKGQMDKIISAVRERAARNERVMVTTLTKRMSEELANYLLEFNVKSTYLHSDLKTLERTIIINDLRNGVYDCLIGVNLLREGIDLPEVSLVCILDADKQGFLRNSRSLIQIMGRAARHINGQVYLFADEISTAMQEAMKETLEQRQTQLEFNQTHNIIPTSVQKGIYENGLKQSKLIEIANSKSKLTGFAPKAKKLANQALIKDLEREMQLASKQLNFEKAAQLRDIIIELRTS